MGSSGVAGDDEVVDESVFGAAHLDGVLVAAAFFESLERGDAPAGRGPLGAPFVDDGERVRGTRARATVIAPAALSSRNCMRSNVVVRSARRSGAAASV